MGYSVKKFFELIYTNYGNKIWFILKKYSPLKLLINQVFGWSTCKIYVWETCPIDYANWAYL